MPLLADLARCRGCLGSLGTGAVAGLCARCWSLLVPLPEERCPLCAQPHGGGEACADPVAWAWGDALWDYHAGLGPLLVPGIKRGELGWLRALLGRAEGASLPPWAGGYDLVCPVPTSGLRRWWRGFDLAEQAAELVARRLGIAFRRVLRKPLLARAQTGLPRSQRQRMGAQVTLRAGQGVRGAAVLVVDDVWTTGTTFLRCAGALDREGAREVAVLALFRAGRRSG